MKIYQKLIYRGTLTCISGLHIGDSKDFTDIGGVDSPVVRRKDNSEPYIPGSSLKGKMRCLLEQVAGENANGKCLNINSNVSRLFGGLQNKEIPQQPSRILVRDAFMNRDSADRFKRLESTDMPYTEVKFENSINRITGVATNPRQQERVPAGAIFDLEFVINVVAPLDAGEEIVRGIRTDLESTLKKGIQLLNDDYLGGSGSRGYGQILIKIDWENTISKTYE